MGKLFKILLLFAFCTRNSETWFFDGWTPEDKSECHCPSLLTFTKNEKAGMIKSPVDQKSQKYCSNLKCSWRIEKVEGQGIRIKFDWFFTETWDFLQIAYRQDNSTQTLTSLRGYWNVEDIPSYYFGDRGDIELTFSTDSNGKRRGFEATFDRFDLNDTKQCGCPDIIYDLEVGKNTEITSPNYPDPHCDLMECFYLLRAPQNHDVVLNFEDFDLEAYDYLRIYDGNTTVKQLARLSGSLGSSDKKKYRSSTNKMFMRFRSDIEISHKGFKAQATAEKQSCECPDSNFTGDYGNFSSPGAEDDVYCGRMDCTYSIEVPEGKVVQLEFSIFKLDIWDSLTLFYPEMNTSDYPVISWSGPHKLKRRPLIYTADTNQVLLKLHTDYAVRMDTLGFKASYRALTRPENCSCPVPNPNTPNDTQSKISAPGCAAMDCIFVLDPQMSDSDSELLKYSVPKLILQNPTDYLKIFLHRYYKFNDPGLIKTYRHNRDTKKPIMDHISTKSPLMIHYHVENYTSSDEKPDPAGFEMTYTWDKQDCHCPTRGVQLIASPPMQYLTSPGFPGPYCNNMKCEWTLRAQPGHHVVLEVVDLKMEHGPDHLWLFDGDLTELDDKTTVLRWMQKLTGILKNFNTRKFRSSGPALSLVFESDFYGTARGFNVTYFSENNNVTIGPVPTTTGKSPRIITAPTSTTQMSTTNATSSTVTPEATSASNLSSNSTTSPSTANVISTSTSSMDNETSTSIDNVTSAAVPQVSTQKVGGGSNAGRIVLTVFLVGVLLCLVVLAVFYIRKKGYLNKAAESIIVFRRDPLSASIGSSNQRGRYDNLDNDSTL